LLVHLLALIEDIEWFNQAFCVYFYALAPLKFTSNFLKRDVLLASQEKKFHATDFA